MEGADTALWSIPQSHPKRQTLKRRRNSNRPRTLRIYLGDQPGGGRSKPIMMRRWRMRATAIEQSHKGEGGTTTGELPTALCGRS